MEQEYRGHYFDPFEEEIDDKQQPHAFDFNHELGCSLQ